MNILFYRYGSICEPAIIEAFRSMGISVMEKCSEMTDKTLSQAQILALVESHIKKERPVFVFSINFFPVIAQLCNIYQIFYLCWTVDSPVMELFSKAIRYNTNRIFMFDYAQYQYFSKYSPKTIYYLPLASDIIHFRQATADISEADKRNFGCDISFVGSLYNEKDPIAKMQGLSDFIKGSIDGISKASLLLHGCYSAEEAVTDTMIQEFKEHSANYLNLPDSVADYDRYLISQYYLGYHISSIERIRTLNTLAQHFNVDLFTRSDVSVLSGVHTHDGIQTLTEMPKVFHLSKINLNMTIKPIQTGLPLRIFDIMGCGGFVLTNYQAELTNYFEIGVDLETYSDTDELIDKCAYYLSHSDEREKIAANGYKKVNAAHTYTHRIAAMIKSIVDPA